MAKFKCKKCKRTFDMKDGREAIQKEITECHKSSCILRNRNLTYIPLKAEHNVIEMKRLPAPANDDDRIVEVFEEEPIGGFISQRELRKKHGK